MKKKSELTGQTGDLPDHLSEPAKRALVAANLTSLKKLSELKEADVTFLHGIGPDAIRKLRTALSAVDLSFRD
ncbi:hypothetical protein DYBT9275_03082 [Dyadobacter sp. CECT 9275]|uniref:DNA-binding protein n=1 Tax=Dyadobacter helix TaxID=2822344 RepID=A0A916N6E5_9BACT|nr:hypothetical protein [Dyadobacter sp. CECT 9275]CAG5003169.1 hypothetical protein DYBT9275_03082 [Dyadobacter sp. CECT 9275]